ncbi:uncharacterized protein A4U43_C01F11200 [Asparagus officinalis]|uniref:Cytochrome P450 n=1 Tax=Asparagus officinalis TaxID=4686 RepID=A0A5P1FT63_ASPOF|nr:cytochrome P450 71A1-like [Asparagus officinalis]ONK79870.1 uncharacterized protein A4U43_C01F11200 [Asparagus officinalis]
MSLEISTSLFLVALLLLPLLLLLIQNKPSRKDHPPSPFKLPIIGNLHQLGSLPHLSLLALSKKHGPIMLLKLGGVQALVVSSADVAKEIMKAQDHIFSDRPSLIVPNKLLYGCKDVAFARYGDYWRNVRKLSVLHLLSPTRIQSYRLVREEEVAFMMDKIAKLSLLGPMNMSDILMSFAKDVISRVAFGKCSREEGWNEMIDVLIEESNELLASFHLGDYVPWLAWVSRVTGLDARVNKTVSKLDEILEQVIDRSRVDGRSRSGTFIDILLSLQKDGNNCLDKDSIKALIEDMFGAGTDSTIIVLEWAMAELIKNPEVMKKLQNEVRSKAKGTSKTILKQDDLVEMNYLRAVIKEVMRLHPPGPLLIPRQLTESTRIQGYKIPKQATVIVNAWAIGRDPKYWQNPAAFRPERFLNSNVDFRGRDFQLIPFGFGRRICPGIQFAMSVIEIALANLVCYFDWHVSDAAKTEVMCMQEAPGITSRKKTRLHVVATSYSF